MYFHICIAFVLCTFELSPDALIHGQLHASVSLLKHCSWLRRVCACTVKKVLTRFTKQLRGVCTRPSWQNVVSLVTVAYGHGQVFILLRTARFRTSTALQTPVIQAKSRSAKDVKITSSRANSCPDPKFQQTESRDRHCCHLLHAALSGQ